MKRTYYTCVMLFTLVLFCACTDNSLIPYRKGNLWGYANSNKKIIVSCIYERAFPFKDGMALVKLNGKFGFIDNAGKTKIPIIYDEVFPLAKEPDLIFVVLNGKYGLIDKEGNQVMPCVYDYETNFDSRDPNVWGLAFRVNESPFVKMSNHKYGFVDRTGKDVISNIYYKAYGFSEGLALVEKDSTVYYDYYGQVLPLTFVKQGFIDKAGNLIIPFAFEQSAGFGNGGNTSLNSLQYGFSNGRMGIMRNKKYGFINKNGVEVIPCIYDEESHFSENYVFVATRGQDGLKWGIIDTNGKQTVQFIYDYFGPFSEGLAKVYNFKPKSKMGYIDSKGNQVVQAVYDDGKDFSDGLAFVRKNKKAGFINLKGEEVIPLSTQYSDYNIDEFHDGLCVIQTYSRSLKDTVKTLGYIDKKGTQYWED